MGGTEADLRASLLSAVLELLLRKEDEVDGRVGKQASSVGGASAG
jgi:hypothetical protein